MVDCTIYTCLLYSSIVVVITIFITIYLNIKLYNKLILYAKQNYNIDNFSEKN